MSEVYDYDDARLLVKSRAKTGDEPGLEATVPEEKGHTSMPHSAGVEMANEKVEVDDSPDTGLLHGGQSEAISVPTVNSSP